MVGCVSVALSTVSLRTVKRRGRALRRGREYRFESREKVLRRRSNDNGSKREVGKKQEDWGK